MAGRLSGLGDLGDELVHIFVGAEKKKFSVHKKLIRGSGDFFRAAFQENGFKEGVENKMDLPEDKPYLFEAFVNWMYAKQVGNLRKRIPDLYTEDNHDVSTIELYIFAEKYQSEQLMNFTMDSLQDSIKNGGDFVVCKEAELIFEYTKSRSDHPLRRFAVAVMAHGILAGVFRSNYPAFVEVFRRVDDILLETIRRVRYIRNTLMGRKSNPKFRIRYPGRNDIDDGFGICEYHQHRSNESCDSLPNYPSGEDDFPSSDDE
ncbi:hypothetical protein EAF04_007316 [Stromatinia cepivora]|nr:hypothetical protein EAF04_007316 [Stromatinia cepivora]